MNHPPFLDKVQSAPWQLPFEDLLRADVEGYLELAVSGVKMRRRMITILVGNSFDRRQSATRPQRSGMYLPYPVNTSAPAAAPILTPTVPRSEFPIFEIFFARVNAPRLDAARKRAVERVRYVS